MELEVFLEAQKDYFHLGCWMLLLNSVSVKELRELKKTNSAVYLTFPKGKFAINYNKLKEEAQKDIDALNEEKGLDLRITDVKEYEGHLLN